MYDYMTAHLAHHARVNAYNRLLNSGSPLERAWKNLVDLAMDKMGIQRRLYTDRIDREVAAQAEREQAAARQFEPMAEQVFHAPDIHAGPATHAQHPQPADAVPSAPGSIPPLDDPVWRRDLRDQMRFGIEEVPIPPRPTEKS